MTRPLKSIKFPVALLNSGPYQDPDGVHTYVITPRTHLPDLDLLHVEGCPEIDQDEIRRKISGTYSDLCRHNLGVVGCTRCQPHAFTHVTLPDGTTRYRPMGKILSGGDDSDPRYAIYALVNQVGGRWQVREWSATGQAALDRASKLGITVILGDTDAKLGLPTPPPNA